MHEIEGRDRSECLAGRREEGRWSPRATRSASSVDEDGDPGITRSPASCASSTSSPSRRCKRATSSPYRRVLAELGRSVRRRCAGAFPHALAARQLGEAEVDVREDGAADGKSSRRSVHYEGVPRPSWPRCRPARGRGTATGSAAHLPPRASRRVRSPPAGGPCSRRDSRTDRAGRPVGERVAATAPFEVSSDSLIGAVRRHALVHDHPGPCRPEARLSVSARVAGSEQRIRANCTEDQPPAVAGRR